MADVTTVFQRMVMMLGRSLGVAAAVFVGSLVVMVMLSGFNTPG
jgi:hypothetical protein